MMFTSSRNDALARLAQAVNDYDSAECMVFKEQNGILLDGSNSVNSHLPADTPAELVQSTAAALNDAYRPLRNALKNRALKDMESALNELRGETQ